MQTFTSTREAKEFLIDQIVQEAQRENVPLSEIEHKMLYFSETAGTLRDMDEVSAEFDREYDQNEYEQKIGLLVSNLRVRLKKENADELKSWDTAIRQLRKEDHYLLVLIDTAKPGNSRYTLRSPIVWLIAFAVAAAGTVLLYFLPR